jgi:nucleoside-diphosphate-sugar epimerase
MDLQGKKLLITGITGFIGCRAAEMALARGMQVRGLVRSPAKATTAQEIEILQGDITDPATLEAACRGVDLVLHSAALLDMEGDLTLLRRVNQQGVINMIQAAQQQRVTAFVHLSDAAIYGCQYPAYVTESSPIDAQNTPYCQSKADAERAIWELNPSPDLGIIIIRAGNVYGPRSPAWVMKPLRAMQRQEFGLPRFGNAALNLVYIDNLIEGIFLALEQEAYGEIFNITDGWNLSCKEYFTKLAAIADLPPPISAPTFLVKTVLQQRIKKQLDNGEPIDVPLASLDWLNRPHLYSIQKAQAILGYKPKVSLDQGLENVKLWLHNPQNRQEANNYVSASV